MKVLVVTGRKAEEMVRKAVGNKADILIMDIDIAAFTAPSMLKTHYLEYITHSKKRYDAIMIPGTVNTRGFKELSREIHTDIVLGPKHAYDLNLALRYVDVVPLSLDSPADYLISEERRSEALKRIEELENEATYDFKLRNVKIGGSSRMKVLGEIIDAPFVNAKAIARRYIKNGADIIDIGIPCIATPADVQNVVCEVLDVARPLNIPISVDTLDPNLILAGVDAGADLVLSFCAENAQTIGPSLAEKDIAVVVIPHDGNILEVTKLAQGFGITRILADPILYPIGGGAVTSLIEYKKLREQSDIPLFLGVGNVVELLEADSIGANALLTGIAMELGVAILFTPEYSDKTYGSIKELKTGSQMMQLAKDRNSPPKDLGVDLLVLKERIRRPEFEIAKGRIIHAKDFDHTRWTPDSHGNFIIGVQDGYILAVHDSEITIKGESAKEILDAIFDLELVSNLHHAGYLGRELKKAEIALKFDRSFSQDDEF